MKKAPYVREAELRLLAESRNAADPRYVEDVVDWIWELVVNRKLQSVDSLPQIGRQRLNTLTGLYA